jgi:hypothetical protein
MVAEQGIASLDRTAEKREDPVSGIGSEPRMSKNLAQVFCQVNDTLLKPPAP